MLLDNDFLMKAKPNECDFKDWLFRDDDAENLKKWVRYSAVDYGDADKVIKDMEQESLSFDASFDRTGFPEEYRKEVKAAVEAKAD